MFGFAPGNVGIGRVMVNLMNGLTNQGVNVDLLLSHRDNPDLKLLHLGVRIIELTRYGFKNRTRQLAHYLNERRPAAILTNKEHANGTAILARRRTNIPVRIVFRVGSPLSINLQRQHLLNRWRKKRSIRQTYLAADTIVAVSQCIADDVSAVTGVPEQRIYTMPNPIITHETLENAEQSVDHPWLRIGEPPVILSIGRLAHAKDYPTLLRAFASVRAKQPCRLVILGEGKQRDALLDLARSLDISEDFDLPGYMHNPHAYLNKAAVFVLSSAWEGSPNALSEAVAVGVPTVATDCPCGPRETLDNGRYGKLVPVGDIAAMAKAIIEKLADPPEKAFVQQASKPFRVENSLGHYMDVLGITTNSH